MTLATICAAVLVIRLLAPNGDTVSLDVQSGWPPEQCENEAIRLDGIYSADSGLRLSVRCYAAEPMWLELNR